MAYHITDQVIGSQKIAETSTTQNHPLGMRVRALDVTYGEGEFIYLEGVTSTAVGSWVLFDPDAWTTTLIAPGDVGLVAVAMSANVASSYGWYQISGEASAKSADVADSGYVYIDTAAGVCDDAAVAGDRVMKAKWTSADDTATSLATVAIDRPWVDNKNEIGDT